MSARRIQLSESFGVPAELLALQRNAILAMSGAGKSNLAVVLAEELQRLGIPWIAIDPKGDWWGVRAAEGGGPGLGVPVLGGERGDLPLRPDSGARIAQLAAAGKFSGVLDVSDFETKAELSRFLTDFARELLRVQRTPLHLFAEECDEYLPQSGAGARLDPQAAICVGAWKRLAKRGRFRGVTYTLISQRAAAVNKDALYQCDNLIALRVVGKRDREAVRGWVEQHEGADRLLRSLPTLQNGEAWLWAPRAGLLERFRARRRWTYDSGRTPELGEALAVPQLAPVDLAELRAELELVGDAGEDELARLRARVAELERALAGAQRTGDADDRAVCEAAELRSRGVPAKVAVQRGPAGEWLPTVVVEGERKLGSAVRRRDIVPQEGWSDVEELQYQKWKARLVAELRAEAPALLKLLAAAPALEVTIEQPTIELTAQTLRGRLARLIAEDFFVQPRTGSAAWSELKRIGVNTAKPNVYRELDALALLGIVTKEADGYCIAPGAKVRLKRAG